MFIVPFHNLFILTKIVSLLENQLETFKFDKQWIEQFVLKTNENFLYSLM